MRDLTPHLKGLLVFDVVFVAGIFALAAVIALDAGADDYVTKPFSADELLARPES